MEEKLFLLTPKSPKSLNSMFRREKCVYLNSKLGLNEGEEVLISSQNGSVKLRVKLDDDVREDCVLIYSGTCGVNNLTSSKHAYGGKFAIYQENKVEVQKI
jgi:Anaerobic dehydrogenases, typically selenocysteine-containing